MPPGGEFYILSRCFSRYKFELRLTFSRQRCSLEISSALHRSFKARLTVERKSRNSAEIVRIPGQHLMAEELHQIHLAGPALLLLGKMDIGHFLHLFSLLYVCTRLLFILCIYCF